MIPLTDDRPPKRYAVLVGNKGRVVLPAEVRRQFGLEEGDRLILTVEDDGSMQLVSARTVARNLKGLYKDLEPGRSWAEELIRERREEGQRESGSE